MITRLKSHNLAVSKQKTKFCLVICYIYRKESVTYYFLARTFLYHAKPIYNKYTRRRHCRRRRCCCQCNIREQSFPISGEQKGKKE